MRYLTFTSFLIFFLGTSLAQSPPVIQWQKCYGGTAEDFTRSLELTADGGFIFCAASESNNGDVTGNHGEADYWLVKANALGEIQWQKCFGGSEDDYGWGMKKTADGGYVLSGYAESDDDDVTGAHGDYDFWIVKTDSLGNMQWQKALGGSEYDAAYALQQTTDHGYIIVGSVKSQDGDITSYHNGREVWVVKLDSTGNIKWEKCLGGSAVEDAFAVQQTTDGGYIVAGNSSSKNFDVSGGHGGQDCWVVKLKASGSIQWQHCYGGSATDVSRYVQQTPDGGYVVIGFTDSNDGDVTGNHGKNDIWVIKINAGGTLQWQKCFGGSGDDFGRSIQRTSDGGYLINGPSSSTDGDVTGNHGGLDYWIAKIDASQNITWQKSVGGSLDDYNYAFQTDGAGNYFIGGAALSKDGDVSGFHGLSDVWIVKLSSSCNLSISANVTDESCAGYGSIDLTVSGGTPPFTYNWSTGATTQDISGLTEGSYSISVTDLANCIATSELEVAAPVFGTPTNISTVKTTSTTATLKWKITGAPSSFNIQYRAIGTGAWLHKTINNGLATSVKLTNLTPATAYEWVISEQCGDQFSPNSDPNVFATLPLKQGESISAVHFDIQAYPNPSDGIFSLALNGITNDQVNVEVVDVSGRILFEESVSSDAESNLHKMNLHQLNNGYYLLRLSDNNVIHTLPLIIAK